MTYFLAQLNIAHMIAPLDNPVMRDFVINLNRVNALADRSPGFIWRLQDGTGNVSSIRTFGDDMVVNMSVWENVEALRNYAFQTAHVKIMRRRKEWFIKMEEEHAVLWWVQDGHIPSPDEASEKLQLLRSKGPCAEAFTFTNPFPRL
jgi:hypothetical protein